MQEYKGVITGIGDKLTGENLIEPQLDAYWRDFVVNSNGILSGFQLKYVDGIFTLLPGVCQVLGYVGTYPYEIPVAKTAIMSGYIYAVFKINHNDLADEFYIITNSTRNPNDVPKDNILNEQGEYWLPIFKGSILTNHINYPAKAVYSDKSDSLSANGTIDSAVTAVTQPVNDDSNKVATTKYVANQIAKEIDADEIILYFAASPAYQQYAYAIKLTRKAKLVVGEVIGWVDNPNVGVLSSIGNDFTLPTGFVPKEDTTVFFSYISSPPDSPAFKYRQVREYLLKNNGLAESKGDRTTGNVQGTKSDCSFGYKV